MSNGITLREKEKYFVSEKFSFINERYVMFCLLILYHLKGVKAIGVIYFKMENFGISIFIPKKKLLFLTLNSNILKWMMMIILMRLIKK